MSHLGPLRHRAYRLVWLGRATSSLGDRLVFIAFAFAVLHVGGSATQLGLILGAGRLARVVRCSPAACGRIACRASS